MVGMLPDNLFLGESFLWLQLFNLKQTVELFRQKGENAVSAGMNFAAGFGCAIRVSGFAAFSIIGDRQPAQVNPLFLVFLFKHRKA